MDDTYNKADEAAKLLHFINEQFTADLPQLEQRGFSTIITADATAVKVRVMLEDKTVYGLNLFYSDLGDTTIGYNFDGQSLDINTASHSGTIEPTLNRMTGVTAYRLNTFTNATDLKDIQLPAIFAYFWKDLTAKLTKLE